jgi:hypothetical protein
MAQKPILKAALAGTVLLAAGCASDPITEVRTEEVKVEVPTMPEAPTRLQSEYRAPAVPTFVRPAHDKARVALTPQGIEDLQLLLDSLDSRRLAWRAFYLQNRQEAGE